ncbi:MAG: carbamoyltransferase N-terminal domain-containing protein, partial [Nitrospinota bacterium]
MVKSYFRVFYGRKFLHAHQGGSPIWFRPLAGLGIYDETFIAKPAYNAGLHPSALVLEDFNGDGEKDIAVLDFGCIGSKTSYEEITVFLGDNGSFINKKSFNVGNLDTTTVSIFLGRGDGSFSPAKQYEVGLSPYSVQTADFNEDGNLDIVGANFGTHDIYILLGLGNGDFEPVINFPVGQLPSVVCIDDFNGDGHQDLAVTNELSYTVSVYLGKGDGAFVYNADFVAGGRPTAIASGDFIMDGMPDLAMPNWHTSDVTITLNNFKEQADNLVVLGINNMHDSSASIVVDGRVVAAAEEERFTRKKHHIGFPVNAIVYCLKEAGITIKEVNVIGVSWKPWVLGVRIFNTLKAFPFSIKAFKAKASRGVGQMGNEWLELFTMKRIIERQFGKGKFKIEYVDHHLCHAISAFFVSPYEKAAVLTVDGAGEEDTTVLWIGEGNDLKRAKSIKLPHSLGQFYAAITGFLGFKIQSDEYKVMGMASYGEPEFADFFRKKVMRFSKDGLFRLNPYFIDYHLARQGIFFKDIIKILGKNRLPGEEVTQRHMNVAKSAQVVLEEVLFHVTNYLCKETKTDNLCLAGGVALNCVANGKLFQNTPFRRIFVQ